MPSFKIKFKNLVTCKGQKMCVLILVLVISSEFSSSTPVQHERDGLVLKTDHGSPRDMSCLNQSTTYLFDLETKKCYIEGGRAPCNRNMRFNRVIHDEKDERQRLKRIGECDCNPNAVLPLVYHIETDQCYPLFQQSYCPKNQWLLYLENGTGPVCKPNPCLSEQSLDPEKFVVLLYGQCVALGANCDPPTHFNSSSSLPTLQSKITGKSTVRFQENEVHPKCSNLFVNYALGSMGVQSCRTGFKKDIQGRCRKSSSRSLAGRSSAPKPKTDNKDEVIVFEDEDTTDATES